MTKGTSFREVCVAIGENVKDEYWPVFVSLECHVTANQQSILVDIMKEAWGARLVDREIEDIQGDNISPRDLMGRILLMVIPLFECSIIG